MTLDNTFVNKFVSTLAQVPATETYIGRNGLLGSLPKDGINRNESNRWLDLKEIVEQLGRFGGVDKNTGVRPLIVLAQNALDSLMGWDNDVTNSLHEIIATLDTFYRTETFIPLEPAYLSQVTLEALPFVGYDERLSITFLQKALAVGRSIARLRVPSLFNGKPDGQMCVGTAWLIAPGLLITNHHVLAARSTQHASAAVTLSELSIQAEHASAWFDYHREGGEHFVCQGTTLVHANPVLDYALLRLSEAQKVKDRVPLLLSQKQLVIHPGKRLNIPQHSGGGPLLYAIRNNFFVGEGKSPDLLHYLTETEQGASGAPVLGDDWLVLALHHASVEIKKAERQAYDLRWQGRSRKEVAHYYNEGIAIHAILADTQLPREIKMEIEQSQSWSL